MDVVWQKSKKKNMLTNEKYPQYLRTSVFNQCMPFTKENIDRIVETQRAIKRRMDREKWYTWIGDKIFAGHILRR